MAIPLPTGVPSGWQPIVYSPRFYNSSKGVLPVVYRSPKWDGAAAVLFESSDAGVSWIPKNINVATGTIRSSIMTGTQSPIVVELTGSNLTVAAADGSGRVDSYSVSSTTTPGVYFSVPTASFSSSGVGWVLVERENCSNGSPSCETTDSILSTTTSGQKFAAVTLPVLPASSPTAEGTKAPSRPVVPETPAPTPRQSPNWDRVHPDVEATSPYDYGYLRDIKGFDTYAAPDVNSVMAPWRLSSPFAAAGVYLGGPNSSPASSGSYSAQWIYDVLCQGWKLIPMYVGLQATCVTLPAGVSYAYIAQGDVGTAEAQGSQAADGAVSLLINRGIFQSNSGVVTWT